MFWWFILICDLLIPSILAIAGRGMWKHCPKDINFILGYRTARSMKNKDTWQFAHEYCGRLWWKLGLLMFVPTVLVHIPFYHSGEAAILTVEAIVLTIQILVLLVSVFLTESALKKTFHTDGTRR